MKRFPEDGTLMHPFQALFDCSAIDSAIIRMEMKGKVLTGSSLCLSNRAAHNEPLVVEITQDNKQPCALLSQGVFHRNPHIVERNVCSPCTCRVRGFDRLRLQPWATLDENSGKTVLRFAPYSEVIGKAAPGHAMSLEITAEDDT
jgi:hypothetical protein